MNHKHALIITSTTIHETSTSNEKLITKRNTDKLYISTHDK